MGDNRFYSPLARRLETRCRLKKVVFKSNLLNFVWAWPAVLAHCAEVVTQWSAGRNYIQARLHDNLINIVRATKRAASASPVISNIKPETNNSQLGVFIYQPSAWLGWISALDVVLFWKTMQVVGASGYWNALLCNTLVSCWVICSCQSGKSHSRHPVTQSLAPPVSPIDRLVTVPADQPPQHRRLGRVTAAQRGRSD